MFIGSQCATLVAIAFILKAGFTSHAHCYEAKIRKVGRVGLQPAINGL